MVTKDENICSKRIKELLCQNRWSVYRLAKESGVPYSTIENILKRKSAPTTKTLEKICRAFLISPDELLGEKRMEEFPCSAQEKRLIRKFRKLSEEDRKMVCQIVGKL